MVGRTIEVKYNFLRFFDFFNFYDVIVKSFIDIGLLVNRTRRGLSNDVKTMCVGCILCKPVPVIFSSYHMQ